MDVMRPQIPPTGGIPSLRARPDLPVPARPEIGPAVECLSCGEPLLSDGHSPRCAPCVEAVNRVLDEIVRVDLHVVPPPENPFG